MRTGIATDTSEKNLNKAEMVENTRTNQPDWSIEKPEIAAAKISFEPSAVVQAPRLNLFR